MRSSSFTLLLLMAVVTLLLVVMPLATEAMREAGDVDVQVLGTKSKQNKNSKKLKQIKSNKKPASSVRSARQKVQNRLQRLRKTLQELEQALNSAVDEAPAAVPAAPASVPAAAPAADAAPQQRALSLTEQIAAAAAAASAAAPAPVPAPRVEAKPLYDKPLAAAKSTEIGADGLPGFENDAKPTTTVAAPAAPAAAAVEPLDLPSDDTVAAPAVVKPAELDDAKPAADAPMPQQPTATVATNGAGKTISIATPNGNRISLQLNLQIETPGGATVNSAAAEPAAVTEGEQDDTTPVQ